ncbi:MAG: DNA polymerase III subunit alpha [Alphaproteobacteria bacterium]|nr:DNA polymerase III subunit alpha [Alphaproteobacteria bacterium]
MNSTFVHLRAHTRYSIGESTLYIDANPKKDPNRVTLLKLCQKYGMPAAAVTDTNLMSGVAELSDTAPNAGIQPIIGITATLNHHVGVDPKILRADQLSQIVLLVQNQTGWRNLCKLNSLMYTRRENGHLGPYVMFDDLAEMSDGIICLSGGHGGPIGFASLNAQDNLARDFAGRLQRIFPDRFYMEIQRHGLENEIKTEPLLLRLAAELNIPIVATNDVCFAEAENYESGDALTCVLQQTKVIDPDRTRKNCQQYFKSPAEMAELFSDLPEAIANTNLIARRCAFLVNTKSKPLLPKFGTSFEQECQMLRDDSRGGLARRMTDLGLSTAEQKPYFDQLEFECDVIIGMGFPGYFLIVADYIEWCRKNDILVGPGRGSGAGSVVAWALGVTNVNPLKYGLLFERFMNPDRISMPDFDVDFEPAGLERVTNYISEKYGADHICRIITFGSLQARGAIRDIGRVFGMPYSKTDRFAKLIPADAKKISDAVKKSDDIQEMLDEDADLKKVVDVSMEIEGAYRNLGQHACGFVIGDRPTVEVAPVYQGAGNEMPSCQFDGHYLESVGLIKFDFLGLETLAILKYAARMIRENHGRNINLDFIPLDDKKTFDTVWRAGRTIGVFQYDAPFIQQTLKKMQPTEFANIVALNALNRPGPIQYIPQYIDRMHGDERVDYVHPKAEEALKETYGIIVYQEQVMQLSRALAGFTRGESDTLRKGMGKKIKEVMDKMRVQFVDGCEREKTLSRDQAEELYAQFMKFAEYAFNKSHSVAYSIIASQCAYLKANYSAEFIAASMSSNIGDSEQLALHIDDAKSNFNLEILPPDINNSESLFSVKGGKIVFALAAVKGVGAGATDNIVAERNANGKFKNITDFATRCAPFINKRILESFAKVGAFDSISPNRAQLFMNTDLIVNFAAKSKDAGQSLSLFEDTSVNDVDENRLQKNMTKTAPWTFGEQLAHEHSALGFYISAHPLDQYKNIIKRARLTTSETLQNARDRQNVQIAASVNSFNRRFTKNGNAMMSINASDSLGNIDAVAFGDSIGGIAGVLQNESLVLISGRTALRDDSVSLFVDSVQPLSAWIANVATKLTVDVFKHESLSDVKQIIDGLKPGNTKVVININGDGKSACLALPRAVLLSPGITTDLGAIGVRATIE